MKRRSFLQAAAFGSSGVHVATTEAAYLADSYFRSKANSASYLIPPALRQTAVLIGSGASTYGPFSFKIFDVEDVEVWTRPALAEGFSRVSAIVKKVNGETLDLFTISVPGGIAPDTAFVVRAVRVAERSLGVRRRTTLDASALEEEFSKVVMTLQELRRDIDRAVMIDFGGEPLMLDEGLKDGDVLMKSGNRLVRAPDDTPIVRTVESFGAIGDCTGVGVGTDDSNAFARALSWMHDGNFRKVISQPGKRYRIGAPIVSGTNPVIGAQLVLDGPITPDTGGFTAITLQNIRDAQFDLRVYQGGVDADYRLLAPPDGSQAFCIKGCRNPTYNVHANSYRGRVLLVDCVGGHFKNSFHDGLINCGDREEALLATPCGQAIYVRGPITAMGNFTVKTPWTKYSPIFENAVDVRIPYAEFGAKNDTENAPWEWRGCGSIWLGTMLGGDETQTQTLMKFTSNSLGNFCRRVDIDLFFSVGAQNAIIFEGMRDDSHGVIIKSLVTQESGGPALLVRNVPKLKVNRHEARQDYQALLVSGPVGYLDYNVQADATKREAILVTAGATGVLHFRGRSKDASQESVGRFAHAALSESSARIDFIDFVMQGVDPSGCFQISSADNSVRIINGLYETSSKFVGGNEAISIDHAQGIASSAYGTATVASGATSVTVNHGLFNTPSYVFVEGSTTDTSDLYVSNKTSTQFTINAPLAVGADRSVDWHAVRRP